MSDPEAVSVGIASPAEALHLLERQTQVLQLLAQGSPLEETLSAILVSLENLLPGTRCSVLLYRAETQTLHHGAAPSLPAAYVQAIDGMSIGPSAGSCGTAVFEGQPVVVEDIASDSRWEAFRDWALPHGLQACWSSPIAGRTGITGTFAVYRGEPNLPSDRERDIVRQYTHLASVAIDQANLIDAEVARRAAEMASRNKSEFVASLSHDIRTPLQTIVGMIEMLRSVDMPAERRQRALDLMGRASSHITDLVNDVLDLARIEAGSLPIRRQDVELAPLLEDVCDLLTPLAEERDVRLTTRATSARVRADARRLRQVLINLGSNAVIHNLPGQSAEISAAEGDSTVTITIEDSGPGIAPDRLERIFLPFERLDADQRDAPGSGLGMALALALTRAMGGDLTVTSTTGHGTTVRVVLPHSDVGTIGQSGSS